jgi:hypothetical protein
MKPASFASTRSSRGSRSNWASPRPRSPPIPKPARTRGRSSTTRRPSWRAAGSTSTT